MSEKRRKRLIYKPLGVLSTQVVQGLLILLSTVVAGADSSVYVPLEHWVYRFVERLEAQGRANGATDGIKPYSRNKIVELLDAVDKKYRPELSPIELGELDLLRGEFVNERAMFHYRARGGAIFADFLVRQQTDRFSGRGRSAAEVVYRHRGGGIVRGHLGRSVGFRMAFEQVREQGSRHYVYRHNLYERRIDLPQLKGEAADFHEGTAYVKFAVGPVDVQLGKDEALWGPAPQQNLGLGNNAPSFNMIRLQSQFGAFKLVSISAELRPCPDRPDSPLCAGTADSAATYVVNGMTNVRLLERQKYLAAHRLEVALAPWLDLGFQEVVVYGDRGLEPSYVNPLMFYWAAQSHLGDKDNLLMGLDLDIHPGRGRRYYLAYVVDDLKKARIFSDDFANKFSLQAGMLWVDPLGLANAELRAEYVRIEPWLYSHRFPINTFRHFDAPLGHSLAPNSDQWQLGLTKRVTRDLEFAVHVTRSRHGDNELGADGTIRNVGGDMHYGWRPGDERATKQFLDGHRVRRTALAASLHWRILPHLQMEAEYAQEWGQGVPLPPAWGPAVPLAWRSGYGDGRQQHLRFDLRFHYF